MNKMLNNKIKFQIIEFEHTVSYCYKNGMKVFICNGDLSSRFDCNNYVFLG
jgi:hypothetical protein